MKKIMIVMTVAVSFAFTLKDQLTGRWETKPSPSGSVTGVVFKTDNTFEAYVNKKPFVSGSYSVKDSVMTMSDNGCDGIQAMYKLIFFSNGDSLRFEAIDDECDQRKGGMSRTILGKVK